MPRPTRRAVIQSGAVLAAGAVLSKHAFAEDSFVAQASATSLMRLALRKAPEIDLRPREHLLFAFRLEVLRGMGCNAIRTSHNDPTPELVDAADRLGMLVLCETRTMSSTAEALEKLSRMVRQFRNHPSVFLCPWETRSLPCRIAPRDRSSFTQWSGARISWTLPENVRRQSTGASTSRSVRRWR